MPSDTPKPEPRSAPTPAPAPQFPWNAFVRNIAIAAVIALVIGLLCYHFLADQTWGEAAQSSLPWIAAAIFGTAVGHAIGHYMSARTVR